MQWGGAKKVIDVFLFLSVTLLNSKFALAVSPLSRLNVETVVMHVEWRKDCNCTITFNFFLCASWASSQNAEFENAVVFGFLSPLRGDTMHRPT